MSWEVALELDGARFRASRPRIEWERSTAILSRAPSRHAATIEAMFPGLRQMAQAGHDPSRASVQVLREGEVVAQGRPSRLDLDREGLVRLTVEEDVRRDRGVFPARSDVGRSQVEDDAAGTDDVEYAAPTIEQDLGRARPGTWAAPEPSAVGKAYPVIFGQPNAANTWPLEGYDVANAGARPLLLLAGHRLRGLNGADPTVQVRAKHLDRDDYVEYAVTHQQDLRGRTCAVVDLSQAPLSGTSFAKETGQPRYFVRYSGARGYGPGAGTLAELLLEAATVRVDRAAWASVRDELDRWTLSGAVTEVIRPVEFLERVLLPLIPCSLDVGPRGLRPAIWRLDATAGDATHHLHLGPDLAWVSGPEHIPATTTEYSLRYAHDLELDRYTRSANANGTTHAHLAAAVGGGLRRRAETIEARLVDDGAVADRVLAWQSVAYGVARRRLVYDMPVVRFGVGGARELAPGDVVTLTDSARGLGRTVALVERIRQQRERLGVTFLILDSANRTDWGT